MLGGELVVAELAGVSATRLQPLLQALLVLVAEGPRALARRDQVLVGQRALVADPAHGPVAAQGGEAEEGGRAISSFILFVCFIDINTIRASIVIMSTDTSS